MNRPKHGGNLVWAAGLAGCPLSQIVDFSASISPLGPANSAVDAIRGCLGRLGAYPDSDYADLRVRLAEFHCLEPDWILPANGSAELLTWAGMELATFEATVLLTPAFGDYFRALNTFQAEIVPCLLPWSPEALIIDLVEPLFEGIEQKQAGLLLNNPHNPTGKLLALGAILPLLEEFGLVVVDEAFMDFLPPHEQAQYSLVGLVERYPNLVILRSLTKFYGLAGLRLGYGIAHPQRLKLWQSWRDPWPVSVLAAAAGEAVVQDREFQEQTYRWLPPVREKLWQGLKEIAGLTPSAGAANFLLVKSQKSVLWLQEQLLKKHQILIRDCLSFPELGDEFFRIAVRTTADNQLLLDGLKKIMMEDI